MHGLSTVAQLCPSKECPYQAYKHYSHEGRNPTDPQSPESCLGQANGHYGNDIRSTYVPRYATVTCIQCWGARASRQEYKSQSDYDKNHILNLRDF